MINFLNPIEAPERQVLEHCSMEIEQDDQDGTGYNTWNSSLIDAYLQTYGCGSKWKT